MRPHVARRTASTLKRLIAGLLLLLLTLCLHSQALKSGVGKRLAVVADAQSPSQLQQQPSEIDEYHEHDHDQHEHGEGDAVVRCRFCGAAVALKKYVHHAIWAAL